MLYEMKEKVVKYIKNNTTIVLWVGFFCLVIIGMISMSRTSPIPNSVTDKDKQIKETYTTKGHDEAETLINRYYKNDNKNREAWLLAINPSTANQSDKLNGNKKKTVQTPSTTVTQKPPIEVTYQKYNIKGGYVYVSGTIFNNSSSKFSYYKLKALFLDDSNNIKDSAFDASADTLYPNESRSFEMMKKEPYFTQVKVVLEDYTVEK